MEAANDKKPELWPEVMGIITRESVRPILTPIRIALARKACKMKLPEINDLITTEEALELCEYFKLDYLVKRLEDDRDGYKSWKFDGCSCLPDQVMGLFSGCNWKDITFKCCLPHDLCYAYGKSGNEVERMRVDVKLYSDLVTKAGMKKCLAAAFLVAAQIGGAEEFGLSFSWGFAHKD